MISRNIICGRSIILRQIRFKNNQLVRNLFILGCSSKSDSQLATTGHLSKPITEVVSPRNYCCKANKIPIATYAEVKDLPNHPEKLLIDVREPSELKATGQIPTSINIPLGIVAQELSLSSNALQFQKKYGRPKPDVNSYIIVHCKSGKRSQDGAEIAAGLGYKNVLNYVGSWVDWAEREGLPKETK